MSENKFSQIVMHAWMRRGVFACLALPVAVLFGLLLRLRTLAYRLGWVKQQRLAVPVIVVGNIFVGGTGKTPFALWLLRALIVAGYRPGVISRGYGGKQALPVVVTKDSLAAQAGDEPVLLAQRSLCPVVVGRDRVAAGRVLLAAYPEVDVIISDDGLQHLALARDVEIVLFDSRGAGNGWLLPAGPLREPLNRSRDVTVVNLNEGEAISPDLPADAYRMQLQGWQAERLMDSTQTLVLAQLDASVRVVAAAGIGNPQRFFTMLARQGVLSELVALPDHYDYLDNPFVNLTADMILITEKDAVKCRQMKDIASDPRIWVVAVEARIESGLLEKILEKLNGCTIN